MQTHIYFPTGKPEPPKYAPIWANKTYPVKFMFSQITARCFTLNQLKEDLYTGVFFFYCHLHKMPVLCFSFEKCSREKQFLFPFISCLCQPKWSWHSSTSCKRGQEERFSIEKPQLASMYVCYLEISLHFRDAETAKFPNNKFAFAAHLFWCMSVMCSRILLHQIFASLFCLWESVCV